MVVRMRHTRGQTGSRRSHHALKAQVLATCECGAPRVSHRACSSCGRYRGRVVIDHAAKAQAKATRRAKAEGAKGIAANTAPKPATKKASKAVVKSEAKS